MLPKYCKSINTFVVSFFKVSKNQQKAKLVTPPKKNDPNGDSD